MVNPNSPAMIKATERYARIVKARQDAMDRLRANHEESLREFEDAE